MDTQEIIRLLEGERERIVGAISALQGNGTVKRSYVRRAKRHLSAAARHKISVAAKKRWAEQKKTMKAAA